MNLTLSEYLENQFNSVKISEYSMLANCAVRDRMKIYVSIKKIK